MGKIKQALCWHAALHSQHCTLFKDGNYIYTCSNCGKQWDRTEIEKIHKSSSTNKRNQE